MTRGFAVEHPVYTTAISVSGGIVVAATERLYRVRRGERRLGCHDVPAGHGDVMCVAVEWAPRGNLGDPTPMLHLRIGEKVVRLMPGDGPEYLFRR